MSTDAVIVSKARTPIGKANREALNDTLGIELGSDAIRHALVRAGLASGEVEEVTLGTARPEGTTGMNIGRTTALWAGLPVQTADETVNQHTIVHLEGDAWLQEHVPGLHQTMIQTAETVARRYGITGTLLR